MKCELKMFIGNKKDKYVVIINGILNNYEHN